MTCGNVVVKFIDSGVVPLCCGDEMEEMIPASSEGKTEYHIPVTEHVDECSVCVKVGQEPHPMTDKHHISFVWLETENGGQLKYLPVGSPAQVIFCVTNDTPLAAYCFCNLHGLWKSDIIL